MSEAPPIHLISTIAIERLAERCALGQRNHGDKAWNAISPNQECLADIDMALNRIGHLIRHAMVLRDKLVARDVTRILEDDDAAAIMWGGMFLVCVTDRMCAEVAESPRIGYRMPAAR